MLPRDIEFHARKGRESRGMSRFWREQPGERWCHASGWGALVDKRLVGQQANEVCGGETESSVSSC